MTASQQAMMQSQIFLLLISFILIAFAQVFLWAQKNPPKDENRKLDTNS
jgi:hypothetical protein